MDSLRKFPSGGGRFQGGGIDDRRAREPHRMDGDHALFGWGEVECHASVGRSRAGMEGRRRDAQLLGNVGGPLRVEDGRRAALPVHILAAPDHTHRTVPCRTRSVRGVRNLERVQPAHALPIVLRAKADGCDYTPVGYDLRDGLHVITWRVVA